MDYRHGSHTKFKIEYHFVWGRVSSMLFEEFPMLKKRYWGRHFWARGYFCVTSGELTKEMIEEYLVHHFEKDPNDRFDVE